MMSAADPVMLPELLPMAGTELPAIEIAGITTHSGRVVRGGLFMACRGYGGHGLEHLDEALAAGPAAVAWEPEPDLAAPEFPDGVTGIRVDDLSARVGGIADRFFGEASAAIDVTGVTGTNGKTTVAWLASRAMGVLGRNTAYMGTLGYGIGDQMQVSSLTTPPCIAVHQRLAELRDAGAEALVMEVSSHGLDQGRVDGVRFGCAAFTNLSRDHLDYHGDMESYGRAKRRLFEVDGLRSAVINCGDAFGRELAGSLDGIDVLTLALDDADAGDVRLRGAIAGVGPDGLLLDIDGDFGRTRMHSPLVGRFNAENLLVALGIVLASGFDLDVAAGAFGHCSAPPGRMQVVRVPGRPLAIIDFAHTPDALENALSSARRHGKRALWLVFGCGGERDQGKRAEMGRVAAANADRIFLTNDNPRHESPQAIVDDILSGVPEGADVSVEPDRRAAIRDALAAAAPDDIVLIAGKGSENYQQIGDRREMFSDVDVASQFLRGLQ